MNKPPPNFLNRSTLLRVAGTLVALALLVYLLKKQGWQDIATAIQQIGVERLILAMALMIVSRLAVSARWYGLLRSAGIKIPLAKSFELNFAGLFANNFLPATIGGDVVRLAGGLQFKLDGAVVTASLVADRLVGMTAMAMVLPFGLPRFLQSRSLLGAIIGEPAYLFSGLVSMPFGARWKAFWDKGLVILRRILNALALWLKQPRSLLVALAWTWVHMICLFFFLSLIFTGMGDPLSFWVIAGLYSLVYFVTLLPISINGYGVQELSITLVFSRLGGATLAAGLTAALLFRTLMMIASLPGAAFVPAILAENKNSPQE
ncbi:MAG TPA: lysylphosphatidylglycerol synthase transmembrane domain-containing protein [Anaerolineales bacterium]